MNVDRRPVRRCPRVVVAPSVRVCVVPVLASFVASFGVAAAERAAQDGASDPRFDVKATLSTRDGSMDGRFAVSASARFDPVRTSADGRFALKAVQADCGSPTDGLFSNGFEPFLRP